MPDSQSWLMQPAHQFGYLNNKQAVCYGYEFMAINAMLVQQTETFDDRLQLIIQLNKHALLKKLQQDWRQKQYELSLEKSTLGDILTIIDKKNNISIQKKFSPPLSVNNKQELRSLINDMPAFLEGMELKFHAEDFAHLYESGSQPAFQSYHFSNQLVNSVALQNQGGLLPVSKLCGWYNDFELEDYVLSFVKLIHQSGSKIPLCIGMESIGHGITIGFSPKKNRIFFYDANYPGKREYELNDTKKLAMDLATAFFKNKNMPNPIMFSSTMFITGNEFSFNQPLVNAIENWGAAQEQKTLDKITQESADTKSVSNNTLLEYAILNNNITTAKKLLENNANVSINMLLEAIKRGHEIMVDLLLPKIIRFYQAIPTLDPFYIAAATGQLTIFKKMLEYATPNFEANSDHSILSAAAKNGHVTVVQYILKEMSGSLQSRHYALALDQAVKNGHEVVITELLAFEPVKSIVARDKSSLLLSAAEGGHIELVRLFINAGASTNDPSFFNQTPLYVAAKNGNTSIVKLLLEKNVDKNLLGRALHAAAEKGHDEIVKLLLPHGVNVNEEINGDTPLYVAAKNGHVDIVNALIVSGADVNPASTSDTVLTANKIPLFVAVENHHNAVVETLIAAGAKIEYLCKEETLLHAAVRVGNVAEVKYLLQYGIKEDINAIYDDLTPIFVAVKNHDNDITKMLLENGADTDMVCEDETLLYTAISVNNLFAVNYLLDHGVDINAPCGEDSDGENLSPLIVALANDHIEMVKALHARGANLNVTYDGMTPLMIAEKNQNDELVNYLSNVQLKTEISNEKDKNIPLSFTKTKFGLYPEMSSEEQLTKIDPPTQEETPTKGSAL